MSLYPFNSYDRNAALLSRQSGSINREGPTGSTGIQGPTGQTGPTGPTGSNGIQTDTYPCDIYAQDNSTSLANNFCSVKFIKIDNIVSFAVYASSSDFTTGSSNTAFFIRPSSGNFSSDYLPIKSSAVLGLSYNMDNNYVQNDTINLYGSHQSSVNILGQTVTTPAFVLFGNHDANTYYLYQFGGSFVK